MSAIDLFANQLLEESKRFLEKAREAPDDVARAANLHASLMLSFCALEAHVNAIAEEFSVGSDLSVHEKGLLLEKDVRLEDGQYRIKDSLKIVRLEERFQFLYAKFSGKPLDTSLNWWGKLMAALQLRNQLTHAKDILKISEPAVRSATEAIIEALDGLYRSIYKKPFPPASQGLHSCLNF